MAIAKTNRINALFDFYEQLLTGKQTTYVALYYRDDFSLGEIAENYNVSRQAVYDNIKRTEKILEEYEAKLHLYEQFQRQNQALRNLAAYAKHRYPNDAHLGQLIDKLDQLED